mgnify:FL=1
MRSRCLSEGPLHDPLRIDLSDRKRWLTIGQAATVTRSSERTVWRWIRLGKIGAVTTAGGRTFVDRETLFILPAPDLAQSDTG